MVLYHASCQQHVLKHECAACQSNLRELRSSPANRSRGDQKEATACQSFCIGCGQPPAPGALTRVDEGHQHLKAGLLCQRGAERVRRKLLPAIDPAAAASAGNLHAI